MLFPYLKTMEFICKFLNIFVSNQSNKLEFFYVHSNPDVAKIQERLLRDYLVDLGKDIDLEKLIRQK